MSGDSKCVVCARARVINSAHYCAYHYKAYKNVISEYQVWKERIDTLAWERYLETILALQETGDWAKQVAAHLLSVYTGKVDKESKLKDSFN